MSLRCLTLLIVVLYGLICNAQVGIGTENPDESAVLELESTEKGFLPPRLTNTERDAIQNPAEGLVIYNTDSKCMQWWNGSFWYDGCSDKLTNLTSQYPESSVFCSSEPTEIVAVLNSETGKTWMDRNLGASRAAINSTDAESYGDLYQWGRGADGHQCVNRFSNDGVTTSGITSTLSTTNQPGNEFFITVSGTFGDWRNEPNNNLWQGVNGINNPCPSGYRIPTQSEWEIERLSWDTQNSSGILKLTLAGGRLNGSGEIDSEDNSGTYWSSTVDANSAVRFLMFSNSPFMSLGRSYGFSVRCIKN